MPRFGRFLAFWYLVIVVMVMASNSGIARQPGLELPPWAELVVHFSEPPEVGKTVELVTYVQILHTDGGEARLDVELPSRLRLVEGRTSLVLPMEAGLRHRHSMQVHVRLPVSPGTINARLRAPLPRRSLESALRRDASSPELLSQRLHLLQTQTAEAQLDAVLRFSSTRVEASSGEDAGPSWQRVIRGPGDVGVFVVRASPVTLSYENLRKRIDAFERHEAVVASSPRLQAALANRPEARRSATASYGDDLHALAIHFFGDGTGDLSELAKLHVKFQVEDGLLAESRAAVANLYALALFAHGKLDEALSVWADTLEDRQLGSLRAYLAFNAGEAQRVSGRKRDSFEWFKSALELRPGLTIARSRLP